MTAIEVEGLSKRYGPKVAVDDVSFAVAEGEIFGLLGRNGAGKSTTVDCLAGLRVPDRGRVRVAGFDPRQDRRELRQLLGVQLQESELPDRLTVAEAMRLYASFYPPARGHRRPARAARPHRQEQYQVPPPVRRPEAAAVDRARADRAAADRHPRRAHDRPRSSRPPGHVAAHRRHQEPGSDDRAGHPLHGRGRTAVRPGRHHARRPDRRARRPRRTQPSPPSRTPSWR